MKNHITLCEHDSITDLEIAIKKTQDSSLKVRLKAILLRRKGKTPQEVAESLMVTDRSITGWVIHYNKDGIAGLHTKQGGRPVGNPKWDASIFKELAKEIDKGGYWSIPRMQEWLRKNHKKDIPEQTVWYRMDQLNYSYKGARPHPVQGNRERQEAFKKGVLLNSWSR